MKQLLLFLLILQPFSVYSQLNESFDHTGVADVYSWQGTLNRFTINSQNELQLNAPNIAGKANLAVASTWLYDNEWRCRVRSDYPGTTQNYINIYLWCSKPDMDYPEEAVFVRLGYTNKTVALCYQFGTNKPKVLLEGRSLFTGPAEVEIKAITDADGNCTLYTFGANDTGYYKEGSAQLPINDASGYFMIGAVYSSAHSRDKFWDDIHIKRFITNKEEPDDKEALRITKLEQVDESTLHVWFDKPVVADYASFVLEGIGEVTDIEISDNNTVLQLIWEKPLTTGEHYRLIYSDIFDEAGQPHAGEITFTATYSPIPNPPTPDDPPVPDAADYGDIIINEVMADPKGLTQLPETEYVELHNTTSTILSLDGWHFCYGDNVIVLPACKLAPDAYAILYRSGREIRIDQGGIDLPLDKFPSQLANSGKTLQLTDATGQIIDQTAYKQAKPGISWERSSADWHLSTNERGGTPGSVNSSPAPEPKPDPTPEPNDSPVESGEIVFNELLPDPFDGGAEYIELYNRSTKKLSINGLSISTRRSDGSLSTTYPLAAVGKILKPEDCMVLTRSTEGVTSFYPSVDPDRVQMVKIPQLANTAATLVLFRNSDDRVIDEVAYSANWHVPTIKDRKGVALERIDPDKESQEARNWTSATSAAGYGTPGYQNSQYKADSNHPTGIDAPVYDAMTGEYAIRYMFDEAGYNLQARVYDLSGRQVGIIANNEPTASNGSISWNGKASDGSRLTPGVYIFYSESYHPNGRIKKEKKVFLVY